MARDVVESCEDVDKASRVPATLWCYLTEAQKTIFNKKDIQIHTGLQNSHQGACVSFKLGVVIGTIDDTLYFIHVGFPVYLCVCRSRHKSVVMADGKSYLRNVMVSIFVL